MKDLMRLIKREWQRLVVINGAIALEPMNWDYMNLSAEEFLQKAFEQAKRLEKFRRLPILGTGGKYEKLYSGLCEK
ncbi:hypothetical protein [Anaerosporobacter sp.]|uniref:hypothetical protein n=1 Tax=Anaerosporobacter sp. TaxID=1872529 RepID=UPI00286EB6BE|nr:hypothetical protein [Anaerosporobacter sp.]